MFFKFNMTTKKQISLFVMIVTLISCVTFMSVDFHKELENIDICERLSNTDAAGSSYEVMPFQEKFSQNRYREKGLRLYTNDKIAILSSFCAENGTDRAINNIILKNISEIYSFQDTILLYIHEKDGKKQLI